GAGLKEPDLARTLTLLAGSGDEAQPWQVALLQGLGQGLQNSARPLNRLWEQTPDNPALKQALLGTAELFKKAAAKACDDKQAVAERSAAVGMLGYGPFATAGPALQELLAPRNPTEIQLAAVRALSLHDQPQVASMLLASWASYSPTVRR